MSKYWHLNTLFWWTRNFKLTHNELPIFTLNFKCQQRPEEADESTIPIIFQNIVLYITQEYRGEASNTMRNQLLKSEFRKALNCVDNFTSMCHSSNELFAFLDYYHEIAMKTVDLVNNFFKIISKYKAVYRSHKEL